MKRFQMLIWLTQLGLSIATPIVGFLWLAVWLRERFGLGAWVVFAGVILGIACAIDGLRYSLKAMLAMAEEKDEDVPPVAFCDHD